MIFNSFTFAIFFVLVFAVYWGLLPRAPLVVRNLFLLLVSYLFYGWWDWRFLSLIVISSTVDYRLAQGIEDAATPRRRKLLLGVSLTCSLTLLGVFKYFNFFGDSLVTACAALGWNVSLPTLRVVLPVGISFYTFQTMSYIIDVYRGDVRACRHPVTFFAFVAFFPQLMAGPIERAGRLLPQFAEPVRFDYAGTIDGCRQILWGLCKKVVIADNLAPTVDRLFRNWEKFGPVDLWIGAILFGAQIYCDFSGYSEMARGTARLLGFRLMRNFEAPYLSTSIQEFWRRWHISLSSWFRDYLYIPLGGNCGSRWQVARNTMVVFAVCGLWHGANWTFVLWGALHGAAVAFARVLQNPIRNTAGRSIAGWLATMLVVLVGWVLFRSSSVHAALGILKRMVITEGVWVREAMLPRYLVGLLMCGALLGLEWLTRQRSHALDVAHLPVPCRWAIYYALATLILLCGSMRHAPFIYFQF